MGETALGTFGGMRVFESPLMTIGPFEDWSLVRSPGRAKRRRKRGFPQRIRVYYLPDPKLLRTSDGSLIGHPVTVAELRLALNSSEPSHG